ncbi:hypothetical protein GCM10009765_39720 [Fodinicola feengrottensis]|uniref:Uncharacterized protein n=1 Tax=Fodinicola feengrottensis TaxID=435914 RepID=A0ABN2HDW1_9ACTN
MRLRLSLAVVTALLLAAGCAAAGPPHTVKLSVTAKEPGSVGEISYQIGVGASVQKVTDADIPWTVTIKDPPNGVARLSLTVANLSDPSIIVAEATFTCTVTVDGKVVATRTARETVTCAH